MPKIMFKQGTDWSRIEVHPPDEDESGLAAEVGHVLMRHGAEPLGKGFVLTPLALRLSASGLGEVLLRHGAKAEYDDSVLSLLRTHIEEVRARQEAERGETLPEAEILNLLRNTRFKRELKDNQLRNLGRLLALRHGANFSVPGAGKTATLLALYESLRSQDRADRLLVVAPKNAFLAWEDEAKACFGEQAPEVQRLTGGYDRALQILADDSEVYLVTYQFLPNVRQAVVEWAYQHKTNIVLDEAHRIKAGQTGVIASTALSLSGVGIRRDILTGTPLPHSPEDLRPQLEFLWPGQRILPDYAIDAHASEQDVAEVQRRVMPLYVRTTKNQLQLPPIEVHWIHVDLGTIQREIYELLRSEAKRRASGMPQRDRAFLRALGRHVVRLLEAATNPLLMARGELFDEEAEGELVARGAFDLLREFARAEKPAKLVAAINHATSILAENPELKVLLWTSFVENILYLERSLAPFNPVVLYGAVGTGSEEDPETREGRIRQFHTDPTCRVMIANPAACGEAISLHKACHHAIYVDRTFNAAHYLQSVDRIHRLGLKENQRTYVYILEARWTIDNRVARRLNAKIEAMSTILNDPGLRALAYDPEDVSEEFPAGLEPEDVEEVVDHLVHGEKE